jgi:hypothetical protein
MKKLLSTMFMAVVAVTIFGITEASAAQVRNEYFWDSDIGRVDVDVWTWTYDRQLTLSVQTGDDFLGGHTVVGNLQRYTTSNGWYFIGTQNETYVGLNQTFALYYSPYASHDARQYNTWRFEVKVYRMSDGVEVARYYTGSFIY